MHKPERLPRLVACGVRVGEPAQHLAGDEQRGREIDATGAGLDGSEQLGAVDAVDVLHRHVELAVRVTEIDDLDEIRMREPGVDARFVTEHREQARIAG